MKLKHSVTITGDVEGGVLGKVFKDPVLLERRMTILISLKNVKAANKLVEGRMIIS